MRLENCAAEEEEDKPGESGCANGDDDEGGGCDDVGGDRDAAVSVLSCLKENRDSMLV
jgi:hypothetical protein